MTVRVAHRADGSLALRATEEAAPYARDVGELLEAAAGVAPDRNFLVDPSPTGGGVTYAEMLVRVRACAAALLAADGDRARPLAVVTRNSIAHATISLAALYAGIPVVPLAPATDAPESAERLARQFAQVRPSRWYAEDARSRAIARRVAPEARALAAPPERPPPPGAAACRALARVREGIRPDDLAKIVFSSGTLGASKAVATTHRMLCANAQSLRQCWPAIADGPPICLDWLPWSHAFGGNHDLHLMLLARGTLVVDDGDPSPAGRERTCRTLRTLEPSVHFDVPRGYATLLARLEADPALRAAFFGRLRFAVSAGAPLPALTAHAFDRLARTVRPAGVPLYEAWGATETAPMATAARGRARGIGIPGPGVELVLVPHGSVYEAYVGGPGVARAYVGDPERTAAAFTADGYFRTGDALRPNDPRDLGAGLRHVGRLAPGSKSDGGAWKSASDA